MEPIEKVLSLMRDNDFTAAELIEIKELISKKEIEVCTNQKQRNALTQTK